LNTSCLGNFLLLSCNLPSSRSILNKGKS
jgi:hypothetical protein